MTKTAPYILVLAIAALASANGARAEGHAEGERSELAKAVGTAKVSLEAGLAASEKEGTPISAKFELEDGKLQLSVYTAKDGKFSEVVVDHQSGKVTETEAITEGEDLSAAKAQGAAIGNAKSTLVEAVRKATADHAGYAAVSAVAKTVGGHAVAEVMLVKAQEWKTVTVKLDE
jgi:hypothetical protein